MGKGESEFEEKVRQSKSQGVNCDGWPVIYFTLIALESVVLFKGMCYMCGFVFVSPYKCLYFCHVILLITHTSNYLLFLQKSGIFCVFMF